MPYSVQGRIEITVLINGTEFPLDALNMLNYMQIAWTTRTILPTFRLGIFDARHVLDKVDLQDGIPISIVVKPLGLQSVTFNFRKYDHKKSFNGTGFTYDMDGYLDFPKFWTGTTLSGFRGTSNDALANIASQCGLTYSGVATRDSQLWMPRNRTFGEWAYEIKKRGFVSQTSCMSLGINPNGTMLYRDVTQLPAPQQTIILGQYKQGAVTAMDYLPKASSGMNNKMTGYQNTRTQQTIMSTTALTTPNNTVTFTPDVSSPLYNKTVQGLVQRGYQSYGGIDVGNTHPNYEAALYQNIRIGNTYSLDVEFLLQSPTNFGLFDTFVFAVDQEVNKQDAPYAGTYTTIGRSLLVSGTQFAEKILGTRQGLNGMYTQG
jgi:hypothetical protein